MVEGIVFRFTILLCNMMVFQYELEILTNTSIFSTFVCVCVGEGGGRACVRVCVL